MTASSSLESKEAGEGYFLQLVRLDAPTLRVVLVREGFELLSRALCAAVLWPESNFVVDDVEGDCEPGGSVRGEWANFTRLVLGGGGGRPDYLQKLKVPEGYEKAVSKPNFASKYALQALAEIYTMHFANFANFAYPNP